MCSFKKTKKTSQIGNLATTSGVTCNQSEIAKHFNDFFSEIGKKLSSNFDSAHSNNYRHYLPETSQHSLFLAPTTNNEVFNALLALKKTNSTGPDGISNKVLQLAAYFIAEPMAHI